MIQRNCEGEDYGNPNPLNLLCFSALDKFDMVSSLIIWLHFNCNCLA